MTPEPQAAPEPLTAEEEAALRDRVAVTGLCRVDESGICEQHAEIAFGDNECEDSPLETARLLATLDAARASQAAPVAPLDDSTITYAVLRGRIHEREVMDDELRAWLLDQSKQAHYFADHPDGQPGDPGGHFDKGAAHMADATLTWISERRDIALRAAAHPDTAGEPGETRHYPVVHSEPNRYHSGLMCAVDKEPWPCRAATEPPGPLPDGTRERFSPRVIRA